MVGTIRRCVDEQNVGNTVGIWSMFSKQLEYHSHWLLPLPRLVQVTVDTFELNTLGLQ